MEEVITIQNFIDGKFIESGEFIDSFNPATGRKNAKVPDSNGDDVSKAVKAARAAFKEWSSKEPEYRAKLLNRAADILESRLDEFAIAESKDQGKPLWLAKTVEIPRAVKNLRHFASTILCDKEICIQEAEKDVLNYTSRSACGVTAIIVPWNLPLYLLTFKLGPALAYGNTVVAKPSEFTSVTSWMLCSIIKQAGFPDGVVNMVFGYGPKAGEALIRHSDVALITFTGSDRAGLHIAEVAGGMTKKVSLEMGGKNPAIVFSDVDMENCVSSLIKSSFLNQGQVCLSSSRIFIEKSIFKTFVERFVTETKKLKVGDPLAADTFLGPVCSKAHYEKVQQYLKIAEEEGATFLMRNEKINLEKENENGYYIGPVVMTGLPDSSRCMQEEIFGPVTCLTQFESEEEVIERANAVNYGLSATLWTKDLGRIHSIGPKLEVGTVWCNCWLVRNLHMPFGGEKRSGLGREGTEDSREFFTYKKTICIKYKTK